MRFLCYVFLLLGVFSDVNSVNKDECDMCSYLDENENYVDNSYIHVYNALKVAGLIFEMPTLDKVERFYIVKNHITLSGIGFKIFLSYDCKDKKCKDYPNNYKPKKGDIVVMQLMRPSEDAPLINPLGHIGNV